MLGCGNSALGEVLYDAGWKNIVNIDVSLVRNSGGRGGQETDYYVVVLQNCHCTDARTTRRETTGDDMARDGCDGSQI